MTPQPDPQLVELAKALARASAARAATATRRKDMINAHRTLRPIQLHAAK
jgi:hypothetical protein